MPELEPQPDPVFRQHAIPRVFRLRSVGKVLPRGARCRNRRSAGAPPAESYRFTTLPDGSLNVDDSCEDDLSPLADAVSRNTSLGRIARPPCDPRTAFGPSPARPIRGCAADRRRGRARADIARRRTDIPNRRPERRPGTRPARARDARRGALGRLRPSVQSGSTTSGKSTRTTLAGWRRESAIVQVTSARRVCDFALLPGSAPAAPR